MTTAVVLMAYGTPRTRDEIGPYYTDIRRGRPPSPEQLADLVARYEAIGGISPLAERTEAQRSALAAALDTRAPGRFEVVLGTKHASPSIEDAVRDALDRGVERIVAVVLAPHHSALSVGQYLTRVRAAAGPLETIGIESWATEPAFVEFLAHEVSARLAALPERTMVLFTAHSLPERIIAAGDRYPDEVRATATAVAARAGLGERTPWAVAWQSAGRTPEPWIGPDVLTVIDDLADGGNVSGLLVCACGFVADHLEVLYDLDIEARARAERRGLAFDRTACVNDDSAVMGALADRVAAAGASQ